MAEVSQSMKDSLTGQEMAHNPMRDCGPILVEDDARMDVIGQNGNEGIHYAECDEVKHPDHYTSGKIECIAAIKAMLTAEEYRGYVKGNVLKYIWRERKKGGDVSLQKAAWYLDSLIGQGVGDGEA